MKQASQPVHTCRIDKASSTRKTNVKSGVSGSRVFNEAIPDLVPFDLPVDGGS